jgi:hypothetical protein
MQSLNAASAGVRFIAPIGCPLLSFLWLYCGSFDILRIPVYSYTINIGETVMKELIEATHKARKTRPDLKMVGASVKQGRFTVGYFPEWGFKTSPDRVVIESDLDYWTAVETLNTL